VVSRTIPTLAGSNCACGGIGAIISSKSSSKSGSRTGALARFLFVRHFGQRDALRDATSFFLHGVPARRHDKRGWGGGGGGGPRTGRSPFSDDDLSRTNAFCKLGGGGCGGWWVVGGWVGWGVGGGEVVAIGFEKK